MTPLNLNTQIMKIYFNFFHISVDFKFKKGQTTSLVQKPYFVALSGRASPTSFQSSHPLRALTFIQETSCKLFVKKNWSRKIAWIRALVNRSLKICSNATLLNNEFNKSKISSLGMVSLAN